MKICGKFLLLLKRIISSVQFVIFIWLNLFLIFFFFFDFFLRPLYHFVGGKEIWMQNKPAKQAEILKSTRVAGDKRAFFRFAGLLQVPAHWAETRRLLKHCEVMRQCAAQFSGVCDRHVLLVLPRPFNSEFKALEEKQEETAFYFIAFNVVIYRITLHLSVMFCWIISLFSWCNGL